jgi:hypothetical protein
MYPEQPQHIVTAYDIALGDENFDIYVPREMNYFFDFGIQVVWAGVTTSGALDGDLIIRQSVDGTNFTAYGLNHVIASVANSEIFELNNLVCQTLRIAFEANDLTGGTLDVYLIRRRKVQP